ncbi:HigA family addiction module antidote protein [Duganella sp. FT134W]|uniref:HigA family addiction module antidote protein n=1 Tax=Duganella margarita TaxID=2692170 RepID=A0A7X4KI37_9BURK|nr:HigA family addiction module antitoxin [Duganella margarita]MYM73852.1 HigA family addiction module antidote protein [Duganella margarita]
MLEDKMRPIHPGEILREDFMVPLKMKPVAFANMLDLPVTVVAEVLGEKRSVSTEIAAHIVRHFGGHVDFWLRLQQSYDEKIAQLKPGQPWPATREASS